MELRGTAGRHRYLLGIVVVLVAAFVGAGAVVLSPWDEGAQAGDVELVEAGADGRVRLGTYTAERAIEEAEEAAGFRVDVPVGIAEPDLELRTATISRTGPDALVRQVTLRYEVLDASDGAAKELTANILPPGGQGEINTAAGLDVRRVDVLGHDAVVVSREGMPGFAVSVQGDELSADFAVRGIDEQDVLAMIEAMLAE